MLEQIRQRLDEQKLDALFVTNKTNIFYLSELRASNAFVLVTKHHLYVFTDSRYIEKAQKCAAENCRVVDIAPGLMNVLHTTLAKHKVKSFGVEGHDMTYRMYKALAALNGFRIEDIGRLIEAVRMEKSDAELRFLRQSQKLNEQLLRLVLREIKIGITEAELAWKLKLIAHDLEAEDLSFPPIIAFGAHSAMPHHEVSHKKKLKRGDIILIDMGIIYKNFCSDMSRTFFTKTPTSQQRKIYQHVLEAQQAGIQAITEGAKASEVDKSARDLIKRAGYADKFGHATGHGIGLDVHELPFVSRGCDQELKQGMVITVEPGIYLPSKFGVRIEDMVEVTEAGKKNLTRYPKEIEEMMIKVK